MIFQIVLFAGVGRVVFIDSTVPDNFFNSILQGWYGLFVLQTTVDNPDVMLPYF
jgi:hypothetical protein